MNPEKTPYFSLAFAEHGSCEYRRSLSEVEAQHDFSIGNHIEQTILGQHDYRVLDIGSGNSTLPSELAERYPDISVVSTDLYSPSERDFNIPTSLNHCFIQADGEQLPIADSSCNLVIMTWASSAYANMGLRSDSTSYILEVGRVLKPGGTALIRPESSKILGTFGLDNIIANDKLNPSIVLKAAHYKILTDAGYKLRWQEDPNCIRIHRPPIN